VSFEALRNFSEQGSNMYYVYIIQSQKDKSYYVGVTEDLKNRLQEHNRGNVRYTSSKLPHKISWYCVFREKSKALAFEKYLKQGSGFAFARERLV
jgi:putative endonuclease